ncbi:MAG TPA: hypothetical protein VFQ65_05265 [Kofleriaceae bacterium]|nr:hypothetical protein [Kofleriaceae bacterium]
MSVAFRITYERYSDLHDDTLQMAKGGLLVRVTGAAGLVAETPVALELVLPDGARLEADARVIQVLEGFGVAVTIDPELAAALRQAVAAGRDHGGGGPARHERVDHGNDRPTERARPATIQPQGPAPADKLTHAAKIQLALHGTRDQRNAILRDTNRTLHPYVLKNPQITVEDVLAIVKNAQSSPELLKQVAERREWLQRPQVALGLARNPKSPPEVAVRALDYVPIDAVRQIAKGSGVLPHVAQAARKKVIK